METSALIVAAYAMFNTQSKFSSVQECCDILTDALKIPALRLDALPRGDWKEAQFTAQDCAAYAARCRAAIFGE